MGIFIEGMPLCLMSYKINCIFNESQEKQICYNYRQTQRYCIFSFILMTTYCGPSDHHLTILQKLRVYTVQVCSMGSHNTYSCCKICVTH
jgi:hypothetical protein